MKYIRTETEDFKSEIFTFPESVNHDAMMEMLRGIKDQTQSPWKRVRRVPVSAGFIDRNGRCYGESFTLNLSSIEDEDTELYQAQLKN